jgi:hypothetical protein
MVYPNRFYTYAYLRKDRTPYYIGKGSGYRAYDKSRREFKPPKNKNRIILLKQNLTEEEAFKHEIYMISVFGRKDLGTGILHNKTNGGEGSSGIITSPETRVRKSNSAKGRIVSEKTRKKLSQSNLGQKRSEETKKKMRGKIISQETREKLRTINTGKKHSQQTKDKIAKSSKGRVVSEETKRKLRESRLGKKLSEETKRKISQSKSKSIGKYVYKITSPSNEKIETNNLRQFCIKNNLQSSHMYSVSRGEMTHYKKWTVTRELNDKT